jgi:hypothetical protein
VGSGINIDGEEYTRVCKTIISNHDRCNLNFNYESKRPVEQDQAGYYETELVDIVYLSHQHDNDHEAATKRSTDRYVLMELVTIP